MVRHRRPDVVFTSISSGRDWTPWKNTDSQTGQEMPIDEPGASCARGREALRSKTQQPPQMGVSAGGQRSQPRNS